MAAFFPVLPSTYPICPDEYAVLKALYEKSSRSTFGKASEGTKKEVFTEIAKRLGGQEVSLETMQGVVKDALEKSPSFKKEICFSSVSGAAYNLYPLLLAIIQKSKL